MELIRSWSSFLAGDQSGDRGQHRLEVVALAEVTQVGPPITQVADAVLDADPLGGTGLAFGLPAGALVTVITTASSQERGVVDIGATMALG